MTNEPDIILGLPGQWPSRSAIVTSIVQRSDGLIFAGKLLRDTHTDQSYELDIYDRDPDLARAFAIAGRQALTEADLAAIESHTATLYLIGKGGSAQRAKQIMQVGARLLGAGALAVKVESAGKAHSASDWRALAAADEPAALYHAYVTLVGGRGVFYSCGMHNIGLPDAVVPGSLAPDSAARLLEAFLLYLLLEHPALKPGHTFSVDAQAPRYRLRLAPCALHEPDDPFHNPYGMWMLE
ncbi:MAG TPA: DUF4261 domain-containing protein [Herpetosiphonaceae bacterium]